MSDALAILIAERDRLNRAIEILQGESTPTPKRGPGRPPGTKNKETKKRVRKPMSAAKRQEVSERMKQYWAERRKTQANEE
ncbi:MAG: hypothetical protein OXH92_22425 [Bryobacterales bacterium]|nr:hypothetical protein [Bryobacterales bacterium]